MFELVATDNRHYKLSFNPSANVLLLTLEGVLEIEDAENINDAIQMKLKMLSNKITLVLDAQQVSPITDFMNIRSRLTYVSSSKLEHIYAIAPNKLTRLWMLLIHKTTNQTIKFINDLDEI